MATDTEITYVAIEGSARTAEEAIRLCGQELVRAGCAKEGFARSCVERERSFPTGICSTIPVAIPHSKSDDISRSALCYLRLASPVAFFRMDDDEKTVLTRHVFNLAIDRGNHLGFLSRIIGVLQSAGTLGALETMDIHEVAGYLKGQIC